MASMPLFPFLLLAACGQPTAGNAAGHKAGATAGTTDAKHPRWSSIQQAMAETVDPSADTLWAAVGSVETQSGEKKAEPHSAQDWKQLFDHAQSLVDVADFLNGLPPAVGDGRVRIADAHIAGTRSAQEIDADIKAAPARFRAAIAVFRTAAVGLREASRVQDKTAYFEAGEALDKACDTCHFQYWHPRVQRWNMPSPDAFKQYQL